MSLHQAAADIGLTEPQMLALAGPEHAVRLEGDWRALLREMPRLGRIMCRTSNDAAVHERSGTFEQAEFYDEIGVVLGREIDLRLFMQHWRHGFAVQDHAGEGRSFQFFDEHGTAVLKVFLLPESEDTVFDELVERFQAEDQSVMISTHPRPLPLELPDAEIDVEGFQEAWLEMEDTVYFADILKRFRVRREQGLRLAPPGHAWQVGRDAVAAMLDQSALDQLRIMVFVRSSGCLQINTGAIRKAARSGSNLVSAIDLDFRFHLQIPLVASSWVVRKPTSEGIVTSLELFDDKGENIALFFGKRGPGMSENPKWRELVLKSS